MNSNHYPTTSSCSKIRLHRVSRHSLSLVFCSPTRTSIEPLTANFMKDTEFGADVKIRSNGSKHAVSNPYSTSEACMCVMML